jgi:hypothetical protein
MHGADWATEAYWVYSNERSGTRTRVLLSMPPRLSSLDIIQYLKLFVGKRIPETLGKVA